MGMFDHSSGGNTKAAAEALAEGVRAAKGHAILRTARTTPRAAR
jgi:hypothetical protein